MVIDGILLRNAMISAANSLTNQRQMVDELNIFPVPDGDTGTNMSMTISAAIPALSAMEDPTVSEVADAAAAALLRGARGNSGVILSLLFRGFSKGLKGKATATGADLAEALSVGVAAAYNAVMKPTEGTILTVSREAAEKAKELAAENDDADAVWATVCEEADASLERTPDLLPALKKAGVVDAGGMGFCIVAKAMLAVFRGAEVEVPSAPVETAPKASASAAASFDAEITFTYCTEFIIGREKGNKKDPKALRAYLESIGDSVVVVDDEDIIKVHVHTNEPGNAMQKGLEYGWFETVKVENMRIQHQTIGFEAEAAPAEEPAAPAEPERAEPVNDYGFVAVAAGDGLAQLFTDLGCDQVVSGGQTMNPSTEDIVEAVLKTPAKLVYVLPNNKNIIMAAQQAALIVEDRVVKVLGTKTVPQGLASMLCFDPGSDEASNTEAMTAAFESVSTGQITFAARDSDYEGYDIKEGEILALNGSKLAFNDTDVTHAVTELAAQLKAERDENGQDTAFITLIFGEDIAQEDADAVAAQLGETLPGVDVTVVNGGQPVYYYILSVE